MEPTVPQKAVNVQKGYFVPQLVGEMNSRKILWIEKETTHPIPGKTAITFALFTQYLKQADGITVEELLAHKKTLESIREKAITRACDGFWGRIFSPIVKWYITKKFQGTFKEIENKKATIQMSERKPLNFSTVSDQKKNDRLSIVPEPQTTEAHTPEGFHEATQHIPETETHVAQPDHNEQQEGTSSSQHLTEAAPDIPETETHVVQSGHDANAAKIFQKHNLTPVHFEMWIGSVSSFGPDVMGYENSKKQWKIFLNPTREHFYEVFDRVLTVHDTLSFPFKIAQDCSRKSDQSVLDDPCEPKIVLYAQGETEDKAKENFCSIMQALEQVFSSEEMRSFACPSGMRPRGSELISQWGPSFTKKRTPLIFYTQGGFTESGRNVAVLNNTLSQQFEGENFYLIKGCVDPLIAQDRITRFATERIRKRNTSDPIYQKRVYDASIEKQEAEAKAHLKKGFNDPISDEEVAAYHNISLAEYKNKCIAETWYAICRDNPTQPVNFSLEQVSSRLQLAPSEVQGWLDKGEELLALQEKLSLFGTRLSSTRGAEEEFRLDTEDKNSLLDETERLLTGIEKYRESFAKPYSIIKLYTIVSHLQALTTMSETSEEEKQRAGGLSEQATKIFGELLHRMNLKRQGLVWELMNARNTPEELRTKIGGMLWGVSKLTGSYFPQITITAAAPTRSEVYIRAIIDKAQAVVSILNSPPVDAEKLPKTIKEFYDKNPGAVELLKQKLQHVINRQHARLRLLEQGETVDLPLFYHATSQANTLFSIATTGIRPTQATFYGAFVSTHPAMLRYGGVIVGLPERAAFSSSLSQQRGSPVLIPDKQSVERSIFQDPTREKWAAFENIVSINGQERKMTSQFLDFFLLAISTLFLGDCEMSQKAYILETLRAKVEESKIMMEYVPDPQRPEQGFWKPVLEGRDKKYSSMTLEHIQMILEKCDPIVRDRVPAITLNELLRSIVNLYNEGTKSPLASYDEDAQAIRLFASRSMPLHPYFFAFDDELEIENFLKGDTQWKARQETKIDNFFRYVRELLAKQLPIPEHFIEETAVSITSLREQISKQLPIPMLSITENDSEETKKRKTEINAQREQWLNLHCIPLFEQLIEFDLQSPDGGPILLSWNR